MKHLYFYMKEIAKEIEDEGESIRSLLSNGPSIVECLNEEKSDTLKAVVDGIGEKYMSIVKTVASFRDIFPQSLHLLTEANIKLTTITEFCIDAKKSKIFSTDLKTEDPRIIEMLRKECNVIKNFFFIVVA